jgi:hypothetical protein
MMLIETADSRPSNEFLKSGYAGMNFSGRGAAPLIRKHPHNARSTGH